MSSFKRGKILEGYFLASKPAIRWTPIGCKCSLDQIATWSCLSCIAYQHAGRGL